MEWIEWAEPIAYGPLNLKPWEFERLQPGEFYQLYEGYRWRQERHEEMTAYFVACLMNVSGKSLKRRLSPKDLLKPIRQPKQHQDKKEDEEYLKELFKDSLREGGYI